MVPIALKVGIPTGNTKRKMKMIQEIRPSVASRARWSLGGEGGRITIVTKKKRCNSYKRRRSFRGEDLDVHVAQHLQQRDEREDRGGGIVGKAGFG